MYKGVDPLNYQDDLSIDIANDHILVIDTLNHLNNTIWDIVDSSEESIYVIGYVEAYCVTSGSTLEIGSICKALVYRVHKVEYKRYMIWIVVIPCNQRYYVLLIVVPDMMFDGIGIVDQYYTIHKPMYIIWLIG